MSQRLTHPQAIRWDVSLGFRIGAQVVVLRAFPPRVRIVRPDGGRVFRRVPWTGPWWRRP